MPEGLQKINGICVTFNSQKSGTNDMAVHEHRSDLSLWSNGEHDTRYRMMEDEYEDSASKDIRNVRHLLFHIEDGSCVDPVGDQVVDCWAVEACYHYKSEDTREEL